VHIRYEEPREEANDKGMGDGHNLMAKLLGFSDLTKKQEDLLKKGFAYNKLGVLALSYQRGSDTYNARVSQASTSPDGAQVRVVAVGKAEVKHSTGIVSAKVKSDGRMNYSADITPEQVPQLKVKADVAVSTTGDSQELDPTLNLGYNLDNARLKIAYNPKYVKANFTVGKPDFGVGLDWKIDKATQSLANHTFAVWNSSAERHLVLKHSSTNASLTLQKLSLSYFSELSRTAQFGAAFNFDYPTSERSVEFGGSYKQAEDLEIRAKVSSSGLVGLAFTKNFNQHLDFTFGTQLDTNSDDFKYGFKINLKN
jgi:hypothetical protein